MLGYNAKPAHHFGAIHRINPAYRKNRQKEK